MKDNETTISKQQGHLLENKSKIKTIKAEINIKNFLSKFGKEIIISYQIIIVYCN